MNIELTCLRASLVRSTRAVWNDWEACFLRNSLGGQGRAVQSRPGCKTGPGDRKWWQAREPP